jgi:hypothetical protein
MHALLALGASHLTRVSTQRDYTTSAIMHRGRAIAGLNAALARGLTNSYGDSDALLAACYALTFQASYMSDGMADFITLVRGCALITHQIHTQSPPQATAFDLGSDTHFRVMEPRLDHLPTIDASLIKPAIVSVEALTPLLATCTQQERQFQISLLAVLGSLLTSPRAGYQTFTHLYATFFDMSHTQFAAFISTANTTAQLLMAHFIALQLLMVPLVIQEWPHRADRSKAAVVLGVVEWFERIFEEMPRGMKGFLEWPGEVMELVRGEVELLVEGRRNGVALRILDPGDDGGSGSGR